MIRTQLSLTEAQKARLDERARRDGVSISHLVRVAVDQIYPPGTNPEQDIAAIRGSAGAWGERDESGGAYVERLRTGARLHAGA